MASYHFPILLGQNKSERIVIIHLVENANDYTERRVVITPPGSPSTPLFKIPRRVKIVDENGGEETDKEFLIDNGEEKRGWLNKNKNKNKRLLSVSIDGNTLMPNESIGFYEFYVNSEKFDGIVKFSLSTYDKDGNATVTEGSLHIVRRVHADTMLWLTADLGSDATQVSYLIHRIRQHDESVSYIRLLDGLRSAYAQGKPNNRNYPDRPANMEEPIFIQEEKNSPHYYKTGNITFRDNGCIDKTINEDSCFINYLTVSAAGKNQGYARPEWDKERNFDRKLINIKMLYSEIGDLNDESPAVNAVNFSFEDERGDTHPIANRMNLIKVLETIYRQIIEVSTQQFEKECKYYSVLLLVPNIYNQKNIDILLYELNELMNHEYGDTVEEGNRKLYDFRIISESDSAFIGLNEVGTGNEGESLIGDYLNRQNITVNEKKDTFLVIDAGKGTTDYSIIRYTRGRGTANNQVTSLDRNGIVGAGGAIDYVFARILARQIYRHKADLTGTIDEKSELVDEAGFVNNFMRMIQHLYPVDQDRFMLIVEKLKISYQRNARNGWEMAKMFRCFDGGESNKIIAFLLEKNPNEDALKAVSTTYKDGLSFVANCNLDRFFYDREDVGEKDKKEVETVCNVIANAIINNQVFRNGDTPLTNSIDYVIFTGRSFLFQPLKEAFKQAIKPRRGVFRENYTSDLIGRFGYLDDLRKIKKDPNQIEDLGNLRIAEGIVEAGVMKPISVRYRYHDLGVNCNSNLCCVKGLSSSGKGEGIISKEKFWEGFKGVGEARNSTYYYIGYNESFACGDVALAELKREMYNVPYDHKNELIKMTLFPVKYEQVEDLFRDAPATAPSTPTTTNDDVDSFTKNKIE